jgi:hypothetical protein
MLKDLIGQLNIEHAMIKINVTLWGLVMGDTGFFNRYDTDRYHANIGGININSIRYLDHAQHYK